jgi:hypothetical protein
MTRIFRAAFALLGLLFFALPSLAAGPTCVNGTVGVAPTATITFIAPTKNTDGTAVTGALTYNLYQGTATGAETKVASAVVAGSPFTVNTGLAPSTTVYWYLTAVENGVESAPTNEVCKIFPGVVPGTFSITIT